ncbi:protein yippee-like PJ691.02 isoform X1 [Macadamia integrifolia]|uniref:protein yippee-like PJ691.02 isoform X1 n=1 Tax=Macadamia integrifolia TaxID=60698 RepID=UPI001C4F82D1|nr:protein yippee-like PJ691.02 isoform X1 [Macadamia integrifolia]
MGRLFVVEIPNVEEKNIYTCANCERENNHNFPFTHIASVDDQLDFGPGAPFWTDMENHILCKVINIIMMGEPEMEDLYHGTFIIREVNCVQCFKLLGLYYITSDNPRFCYIEGNFLLQREALNRWDHGIRVAH